MQPISQIELHLHSSYSDGKYTPAELLAYASQAGVHTLAITDHDNTNGCREALPIAASLGIRLIPGIEFTSSWPDCEAGPGERDIDVLGYFIDIDHPEFQALARAALDDIHERVDICCQLLTAQGYPVELSDVFAENPHYGGVLQLIHALEHKGYAPDFDSAFPLVAGCWAQVRACSIPIQRVIQTIRNAGGVAVLAHPSMVKCGGDWIGESQLAQLVQMGLDGLEIYHHSLDETAREYFLSLARRFDLLVTGGSDSHGWFDGFASIGQKPVTPEMVTAMEKLHLERL